MALETGTYISDLVATNPTSTDPKSEGDNHLRLIKSTVKATFPNVTGAITKTHTQLNNALDKTGDTMTGNLTVPSLNTGQLAGLRNKIINGKMEIAQRGTSFPAIASGAYSLDRWFYVVGGTTAVATVTQQSDAPSTSEFQNSLRYAVTTADAIIAAGDYASMSHRVEGFNSRDLTGRTFTLSFWVRSSKTGIHCVSFKNSGADRTYVTEYTVNVANTWEQKSVTVTGGLTSAGTWNFTTGMGLEVGFALAAGSTFQTTANAWQTGSFVATSSQVNCLDTIGNIFAITGVQLEVGSVATPFEHRPYGLELALCQRYYQRIIGINGTPYGVGICNATTGAFVQVQFVNSMRVAPTALDQTGVVSDYHVRSAALTTVCSAVPVFSSATTDGALITATVASGLTVGDGALFRSNAASTYLGFSAEL